MNTSLDARILNVEKKHLRPVELQIALKNSSSIKCSMSLDIFFWILKDIRREQYRSVVF